MGASYEPEAARGFRWDDPALRRSTWPVAARRDLRARRDLPRLRPGARPDGLPVDGRRRRRAARAGRRALPDLPQHHRRRRAGDARACSPSGRAARASTRCPSGTPVLDWTVPPEWNIRDAYDRRRRRPPVVDFAASQPPRRQLQRAGRRAMTLDELRPHLHTLPDQPDLDPVPHVVLRPRLGLLPQPARSSTRWSPGEYEVVHRLHARAGAPHLRRARRAGPRRRRDPDLEPRLPSVAGRRQPAAASRSSRRSPGALLGAAAAAPHVPVPVRTGHDRRHHVARPQPRRARADPPRPHADVPRRRPSVHVQAHGRRRQRRSTARGRARARRARPSPTRSSTSSRTATTSGSTTRRASACPVGSLMRGRHGQFPEYHTSADDLDVRHAATGWPSRSRSVQRIVDVLDRNRIVRNLEPYGEPQLGRRGLYRALGGTDIPDLQLAMLWVLNLADGDARPARHRRTCRSPVRPDRRRRRPPRRPRARRRRARPEARTSRRG